MVPSPCGEGQGGGTWFPPPCGEGQGGGTWFPPPCGEGQGGGGTSSRTENADRQRAREVAGFLVDVGAFAFVVLVFAALAGSFLDQERATMIHARASSLFFCQPAGSRT